MKRRKRVIAILVMIIVLLAGCGKKKIDVTENLQITFNGYNGSGSAELQNAYAWENEAFEAAGIESVDDFGSLGNALNIEMAVSYVIEPNVDLSNGDTVTVKAVIDEAALEDYDFELLAGTEKTFTVADLPELQEVDPFENVEVIYEGISSNARATVVQGGILKYPMDFYYKAVPNDQLKNGDVITVTITNSDPEGEAIREGYRLTSTEKEFTVSGLSHYAENLAEIPVDAIEQMKVHTEDMIEDDRAEENARYLRFGSENLVYSIKNKEFIGNYFLYAKDENQMLDRNYCYCVYKIDMTGKEDFSYYYAVGYYGILLDGDDVCSYDLDSYRTCSGIVHKDFVWFPGCESLDELFNDCVTQNLEWYTYESTVKEK